MTCSLPYKASKVCPVSVAQSPPVVILSTGSSSCQQAGAWCAAAGRAVANLGPRGVGRIGVSRAANWFHGETGGVADSLSRRGLCCLRGRVFCWRILQGWWTVGRPDFAQALGSIESRRCGLPPWPWARTTFRPPNCASPLLRRFGWRTGGIVRPWPEGWAGG